MVHALLKAADMCPYLQNFPEHQFPSIVGRPILRSEERAGDIVVKDIMCGDEAAAARSMLQITYPVRGDPGGSPAVANIALDPGMVMG